MSDVVTVDRLGVVLNGRPILKEISFGVARQTIHAIVGPNGAGKTTLLRCLLGALPHDGQIQLSFERGGVIGYVPQSLQLSVSLPLTVCDFLRLAFNEGALFLRSRRRMEGRLTAVLERVGCEHLLHRPMATLSGGELRRVLIGQALYPEPELLLLDEPTANLDAPAQQQLERLLLNIRDESKTTIAMVVHDAPLVDRCADAVTELSATGEMALQVPASPLVSAVHGSAVGLRP